MKELKEEEAEVLRKYGRESRRKMKRFESLNWAKAKEGKCGKEGKW